MCKFRCAGRRASRAGIAGTLVLLLLSWALAAQPAAAACLPNPDPAIRALQTLVDQDANAALRKVAALLKTELASANPNTQRLASLYSVQAQAYSILELESKARDAVFKGLKFATDNTDPVRIMLLSLYAENVYDQAGIAAADKVTEEAQAVQNRGSLEDICLLIGRGLLQYREDREDLAIGSLTQAYRSSTTPAFAEPHVLSAAVLATVLRSMGDYPQALALNQEAIDWDTATARAARAIGRPILARPDSDLDAKIPAGDR